MTALTLLGTKGGPAIRPGSPMPTASLLELDGQMILIDAGLGAAQGVIRAGVALGDLDAIVITHLHSDHYLDLGPLLHTAWTAGLARPLPIYGPEGLAHYWQHFCEAMRFDIDLRIADEGRPDLRDLADLRPGGQWRRPFAPPSGAQPHPRRCSSPDRRKRTGGRAGAEPSDPIR